jgi:hypothetical protein
VNTLYYIGAEYGTLTYWNNSGDDFMNMSSSYKFLDLTKLGTAGQPSYIGGGNPANLVGMQGGVVVNDGNTTNGNLWLYIIPFATHPGGNQPSSKLNSTCARVIIGEYAGGVYTPQDPGASSAVWQVVDLDALLGSNPTFAAQTWSRYFTSGPFTGQSQVSAWQGGWVDVSGTHPQVAFQPSDGSFGVLHDVTFGLNDPAGWTVYQKPANASDNTFLAAHYCSSGQMVNLSWGGGAIMPLVQMSYPSYANCP